MNGFLVVEPRPRSLLQHLTGGKPPQNVFVATENLIARKPLNDLAVSADKGVPKRRLRRPGLTRRASGTTKTPFVNDRGLAGRLHGLATTPGDFSYVYGSRPFTPTSDRETACVAH